MNLQVRNLGLPVSLAERYFQEGADKICFLNITGFRDFPLGDLPMLEVGPARDSSGGFSFIRFRALNPKP